MVEAVILDVGGVFLLPEHRPVLAALERIGIEGQPSRIDPAHYAGIAAYDLAGRAWDGKPGLDDAYRLEYLKALGIPDGNASAVLAEFFSQPVPWTRVVTDSASALHTLAQTGLPLAIVSNADGTVEEQLRLLSICQVGEGLGASVGAIIDSTVAGIAKPDRRIFELALRAIGVKSDRAIYIGDSIRVDVEGARAAGIRPLHFDPYGLCRGDGHEDVASLRDLLGLVD